MNCQEIQPALSEYIEKSLDPIRMKAVETHLISCIACRAEAESLIDCIQQVAQLPILDPPLGFAQRVMTQVREIEAKPSKWQKLFTSFKIAVPLQATAVALIAVLALTLYQKQTRNHDLTRPPMTPISPAPLSLDQAGNSPTQQAFNSVPTGSTAIKHEKFRSGLAQLSSEQLDKTANVQPSSPKVHSTVAAQSPGSGAAENSAGDIKNPFTRRTPIQAQEVATGIGGFGATRDPFENAPSLGGSFRPGFFGPEHFLSPMTEPMADIEFMVRRRAQSRDENIAGNDASRQHQENGVAPAAIGQGNPPSVAVREVRWFAVPADQYQQFRKELVSEADIESEKQIGAMEKDPASNSNRELLIKVIIVSPAER